MFAVDGSFVGMEEQPPGLVAEVGATGTIVE